MEEITGYKTSDGKVFADKTEAEEYEAYVEFEDWYCEPEIEILGMPSATMFKWLRNNKAKVLEALNAPPTPLEFVPVSAEEIAERGRVWLEINTNFSVPYPMTPSYWNSTVATLRSCGLYIVKRKEENCNEKV